MVFGEFINGEFQELVVALRTAAIVTRMVSCAGDEGMLFTRQIYADVDKDINIAI